MKKTVDQKATPPAFTRFILRFTASSSRGALHGQIEPEAASALLAACMEAGVRGGFRGVGGVGV